LRLLPTTTERFDYVAGLFFQTGSKAILSMRIAILSILGAAEL
jgi:hypothetical protein